MIDLVNDAGRTLLFDGLAQNDVDMDFHKLLNLDTSNLPFAASPPTIHPPVNQWLHDWDNASHTWTATQPGFSSLSGNLTPTQQLAITAVGTILAGVWQGSPVVPLYLPTLDKILPPLLDLNLANRKIINLANPTQPQDAVTLEFMDNLLQGLNPKPFVKVASTSSLPFVGQNPIDGIPISVGDRVLAKNESARPFENGIWIVTQTGHWTRATDCSEGNSPNPGGPGNNINRAYCFVQQGNINANTSWVETNVINAIDTDPVNFVLFSAGSSGGQGPPGPPGPGVPAGGTANQILSKIDGTNYNTQWVNPGGSVVPSYAILQTSPANPTGTSNTTGRMMGLAGYITTMTSGKLLATIAGFIYNNNAAGAAGARLCIGPGTAPVNGAVQPSGSLLLGADVGLSSIGANRAVPFSVSAIISGLSVGLPVWFDLLLQAVTTGTAVVGGVSITVCEIP